LETTVGPGNQASRRTFAGLAGELGAHISEQPFFDRQPFGGADHDDEMLFKIGPFSLPSRWGRPGKCPSKGDARVSRSWGPCGTAVSVNSRNEGRILWT